MPTTKFKSKNSEGVKQSAKEFAQAGKKLVNEVLTSEPVKKAAKSVKDTGKKVIDDISNSPKIKKAAKTVKTKSQKVVNKVAPAKSQETFKVKGEELIKKVKEIIKEGNVRRIIIKNEKGKVMLEIPVTFAVVGTVFAPILAAVGALAALVTKCTIVVERK